VEKVAETAEPAIKDTFVLIFEPNTARFYNLSERAMYKNKDTLLKVIKLLDENPDARLLIEGYANPVLGTQTEARQTLKPLSENRAAYIANALIACGVSPDRLVSVGEGGNRPLVPREDRTNWEQNRRVELRFIW
jgi:outer membrane protein OmpA-like peptidoglycan-associated protein